jgi:hypothetical protein
MTTRKGFVCRVCGKPGEVAYPDGRGHQIYYCGIHEPTDSDRWAMEDADALIAAKKLTGDPSLDIPIPPRT